MAFIRKLRVRFEDVDYAQVVYFPNLFGYCHNVFEDFFEHEVGALYSVMLRDRKVAFPSVHAEADFKRPLRFGDLIRVEMDTLNVGESSIRSRYRMFLDTAAELLAEVQIVTSAIDLAVFRATPIPADVRAAFERHLVS